MRKLIHGLRPRKGAKDPAPAAASAPGSQTSATPAQAAAAAASVPQPQASVAASSPQAGPSAASGGSTSQPSTITAQAATVAAPVSQANTAAASNATDIARRILDAAVEKITEEKHKAAVKKFIAATDIKNGFTDEAQKSFEQLETSCSTHQWTFEIRGHAISPGEVARGVTKMFRQAKPLLNVVAGIEPLYAGIPIAAINAVLGVLDLTESQTKLLLTGLSTSVFMLHQLVLYRDYLDRIYSHGAGAGGAAAKGLEDALSDAYARTLTFLVLGQESVDLKAVRRAVRLLFNQEMISQFQAECDRDCTRLEQTAQQCFRQDSDNRLDEIRREIAQMKKLDPVLQLLESVNIKLDLNRLQYASAAAYNVVDAPKEGTMESYCLAGTRETLIKEIISWCGQSQEKLYWLRGMAGTGKSTLIRTVSKELDGKGMLAGSFFFRQDMADQKDGTFFVQTIVRQLLTTHRQLKSHVAAALDEDLTLPGGAMSNRFAKLLRAPLAKVGLQGMVVVVDALDECQPMDARVILQELAALASAVDLKILVTSRPEEHLLAAFRTLHLTFSRLEDMREEETEADLRLFIQHQFDLMAKRDADLDYPLLTVGWPDDATQHRLVLLNKPLFIFAATLIRYISEQTDNPEAILAGILDDSSSGGGSQLEKVYLPILKSIHHTKGPTFVAIFHKYVGAIVMLQDPLSIPSLAKLLGETPGKIFRVANQLQSVLYVPAQSRAGDDIPVRVLHKSFPDFLLDSDHEYRIDQIRTHKNLLEHCLKLMTTNLRQDICQVKAPGTRRADFDKVSHFIPPELRYACIFWTAHVAPSEWLEDDDSVHTFLTIHLLHWLEALSWLDRAPSAVSIIVQLQSRVIKEDRGQRLSAFLYDAYRFVLANNHAMNIAPLQVYYSALVFAPETSIIRRSFTSPCTEIFSMLPEVPTHWSPMLQTLEGHRGPIGALTVSPDGTQIVSGGYDHTVRVWDAATGAMLRTLDGHSEFIFSVAVSADNTRIASSSEDKTVRLWDASGALLQTLVPAMSPITRLAILPNGNRLVLASKDATVQVWDDTTQDAPQPTIQEYAYPVACSALSPDGTQLAVATASGNATNVRLWDTVTGALRQTLILPVDSPRVLALSRTGMQLALLGVDGTLVLWDTAKDSLLQTFSGWSLYYPGYDSLVFSPDGNQLAQASGVTLRLWDVATGALLMTPEGSGPLVFLPSGKRLASVRYVEAIQIWDIATVTPPQQPLKGHAASVVQVTFSSNGKRIASGSLDGVVQLWDPATGDLLQTLDEHHEKITTLSFSPDTGQLVSGDKSGVVHLWDAATGAKLQTMEHEWCIYDLLFSPDGRQLASRDNHGVVHIWDAATGAKLQTMEHQWWIYDLLFSPDGRQLVSGDENGLVHLWDLATGAKLQTMEHEHCSIMNLLFSPDGRQLASEDEGGVVHLWDTATGALLQTTTEPHDDISFTVDGALLLTNDDQIPSTSGASLAFHGDWLQLHGYDILWLPVDFRIGWKCTAHGRTLVIGQRSGAVSFFQTRT